MFNDIESIRKGFRNLNEDNYSNQFEFEKAREIGLCLLGRAERMLKEQIPKGRFEWVDDSYGSPEDIIQQAKDILKQLKSNRIPYVGRFAEIGGTVIDHALIEKDGVHHLFYIRGKAVTTWAECPTNNFGHAVSTDLINWEVKEPVLQTKEGEWDEYQVWAPHVIYHEGEYWMFYTGVNNNVAQAIGLAKSRDLYHWERYENNPVIIPGKWAIWNKDTWSDGRDPCILKDGDTFYAYYCAHMYSEEYKRNIYAIGVASSKNLYDWKDEGYFVLNESLNTPPDSPFVVKKDNKYYLFYTDYKAGTVFAVSDKPTTGFVDADPDIRTIIGSVSASEVYFSKGKWYISYISNEPNQLHFFEIKELVWNLDGSFLAKTIE